MDVPIRRLGRSNIEVSTLGMGCWAIGGPWSFVDHPAGWGKVDDEESLRGLRAALDLGVNFFDTAANYGCGHSERLLGRGLIGQRQQVVIATKFGYQVDEDHKIVTRYPDSPAVHLREDCLASLRRLNTDYIDLYQFHVGDYDPKSATEVRDALEDLVSEGLIRWYGWSTDNVEGAKIFSQGEHCTAIQHILNMGHDAPEMLALCEQQELASVNRSPLGMGMLGGKFTPQTRFPEDDVRHNFDLRVGPLAERFSQLEQLRQAFASDDRALAQIALAWIWKRSPVTIPIPGFKTVEQVLENIEAALLEPLTPDQMLAIDTVFGHYHPGSG